MRHTLAKTAWYLYSEYRIASLNFHLPKNHLFKNHDIRAIISYIKKSTCLKVSNDILVGFLI